MEDEAISKSVNSFAMEMYSQLKKSNENLFFSPLSLFTALTMVYIGARNETEEELKKTLHLTISQRRLPNILKNFIDKITTVENTEINIANSIWADNGYELLEAFLYIIDENYDGALYKEDFNNVEEICSKINDWVSEKTEKKIKEIINPKTFDPSIKLILLNAIYFNGIWEKNFKEDMTEEAPFYLLNGGITPAPLMHQQEHFSYFEDNTLQILELSYKGSQRLGTSENYSMVLFLPKDRYGLKEMEENLTIDNMTKYLEQLKNNEVKIYIPKFKIETKYKLKNDFRAIGLNLPFSSDADFSGIVDATKSIPPVIGEIIHKAFVDVNEEGTEAAAVTMITGVPKGMPIQREISLFKADHPFLFIIQDNQTKSILFIGRVLNPTS